MIGRAFRRECNVFSKDYYRQNKEKECRRCRSNEKAAGEQPEENPPGTNSWSKRFDDSRINAEIGVFLEGAQSDRCRYEEQQNAAKKANGWGIHRKNCDKTLLILSKIGSSDKCIALKHFQSSNPPLDKYYRK